MNELDRLRTEVADLQAQLYLRNIEEERLNETINTLEEQLRSQEEETFELECDLDDANDRIIELESKIEEIEDGGKDTHCCNCGGCYGS